MASNQNIKVISRNNKTNYAISICVHKSVQWHGTNIFIGFNYSNAYDRNLQDGSIEVDGGVEVSKRSPGKLRQLNTDTGLYVGKWHFYLFERFSSSFNIHAFRIDF